MSVVVRKFAMTAQGVVSEAVTYDIDKGDAVRRLHKAIEAGRQPFVPSDLTRLDSGALPLSTLRALYSPEEWEEREAITRRIRELEAERAALSEKLRRMT